MNNGKKMKTGFKSGQICQLGITTPDIEESMRVYSEQFGVGPWNYMKEFSSPHELYRGTPDVSEKSIAMAYTGSIFIELIQQRSDEMTIYKEHFQKYGYGLHHYGCFVVPEDFDNKILSLEADGYEVAFEALTPTNSRVRYMAPIGEKGIEGLMTSTFVGYVEVIELTEDDEKMFLMVMEESTAWDGKKKYIEFE